MDEEQKLRSRLRTQCLSEPCNFNDARSLVNILEECVEAADQFSQPLMPHHAKKQSEAALDHLEFEIISIEKQIAVYHSKISVLKESLASYPQIAKGPLPSLTSSIAALYVVHDIASVP
jgi:hypothetical protein